ncbi:hypothetical protein F4861DRAFT_218104 [Xylaria intraflava]|nr:hypothetical protein F4861DRAFT_218104 [Xylaria intraflava]
MGLLCFVRGGGGTLLLLPRKCSPPQLCSQWTDAWVFGSSHCPALTKPCPEAKYLSPGGPPFLFFLFYFIFILFYSLGVAVDNSLFCWRTSHTDHARPESDVPLGSCVCRMSDFHAWDVGIYEEGRRNGTKSPELPELFFWALNRTSPDAGTPYSRCDSKKKKKGGRAG